MGVPDILVNNAGALEPGFVVDADYDGWDKMIDVNIRSHLYVLGEFLPGMKERGTGHVVNITSDSEKEPFQNLAVYCGTKHFWTGFSAALRWDTLGFIMIAQKHGIGATYLTVNADDLAGSANSVQCQWNIT